MFYNPSSNNTGRKCNNFKRTPQIMLSVCSCNVSNSFIKISFPHIYCVNYCQAKVLQPCSQALSSTSRERKEPGNEVAVPRVAIVHTTNLVSTRSTVRCFDRNADQLISICARNGLFVKMEWSSYQAPTRNNTSVK